MLTACNYNTPNNLYQSDPKNIAELHSGFNKIELSTETRQVADTSITIVATGHLYPLLKYPLVFKSLVATIKDQNPDYVFILGDWVYNNTQEEWDSFFSYFNELKDKLYFAPGNHDLNYHYERYAGKRDNQFEAEQRYIENVGYRYKVLKDNIANYVFVNMNDSIDRIISYLDFIDKDINNNKPTLFLSSQCVWHSTTQDPKDVRTWPLKSFTREELLPHLQNFDYLIHGDWNKEFYRGFWPKENGYFHTLAVGNKRNGDSLFISRLIVSNDTLIGQSIVVPVPAASNWYK